MNEGSSRGGFNPQNTTVIVLPESARDRGLEPLVSYLVVIEGVERGRIISLNTGAVTFGRQPPADILLTDSEVSRRHCRVQIEHGDVIVTDLGSTNGTFVDGARVNGSVALPQGGYLQLGTHVLKHERRSHREMEQTQELDRSLERARQYVRSLLPAPLTQGPIRTEWLLLPSARLGGDAFGYRALDEDRFALYLFDVSGHGPEAAMLAVAVMNFLRLPVMHDSYFGIPGSLMHRLNQMFQMEEHGNMFFTIWYGVYSRSSRMLDFASAGHHPAYLVPQNRNHAEPLYTRNVSIGMVSEAMFTAGRAFVPPQSTLYLFSDGVFEFITAQGEHSRLDDFLPLLTAPTIPGMRETERLHQAVQRMARRAPFDDDFSLLVASFD